MEKIEPSTSAAVRRFLPALKWLPSYQASWLRSDVIAGLTVTALLIPEGMAYAQIAGMPPETAFYAAPVGLVLYALFGTSRQLVVAVSAAIAAMSAATVGAIAPEGSPDFVALTAALAILAGLISIAAGALKLGRIAQFFSESVMTGFVFGLALVIAIKQVPKMLGIESGHGNFFERLWDILIHLDEAHGRTLMVGFACLALMLALEHFVERIPAALAVLVFGIVVSALLDLEERGVEVVGEISGGLAAPKIPHVSLHDTLVLFGGAAGLALVVFAEGIGPARYFARRHRSPIDPNQELIGFGAANLGAGLFQGFPIGSSLSKSAANDHAGAHTQVSALVAAGLTALVALFLTPLFRTLPEATLGAIVVVAVSGMMRVPEMKRLASLRRVDFGLALVALFGVLVFEVLPGLIIAVAASLLVLIWRASQPKLSALGHRAGTLQFGELGGDDDLSPVTGLLILRPDEELFFANAAAVRESVLEHIRLAEPAPKDVLINLQATTDLDVPTADALKELSEELEHLQIGLSLSHVHPAVRDLLDRTGVTALIGPDRIHATTLAAMFDYLMSNQQLDGVERTILADFLERARALVNELNEHRPTPDGSVVGRLERALEELDADLAAPAQQDPDRLTTIPD